METRARLGTLPRLGVMLAVLLSLLVLATAIAFAAGNTPPPVPPPFGPARNGLIAYGLLGDIWVMDEHGDRRTQLTSGPDLDYPGNWSPDGTWLAYWSVGYTGDPSAPGSVEAATRAGTTSVKVIRADGSDGRTLVSDLVWPSDCGTDLSWSPNSSSIAYAYVEQPARLVPKVAVVPLTGGPSRDVADYAATPVWSPDGRTLAFLDRQYLYGPDGTRTNGQGISLVSAEGGEPRPLTVVGGSGCAFNEPQWSNDGNRIAFYGGYDGGHDVYVAQADGSGEVAITTGGPDEYWPRWSPDDSRIAYDRVVLPGSNAPRFVLTDPDGGNEVMLDHQPLSPRYPTWSPDGGLLLGMTMNDTSSDTTGLILVDVTGTKEPVTLATGPLWGDPVWQRLAP